jgi:hypothetical protein
MSAMILLLVFSRIIFCGAAAYTNTVPGRGHCRSLSSHSFDAGQSCLAATTGNDDLGLLTGIDVETAEYYSSKLKMDSLDDVQWLVEPGHLWEAATKDAKAQGNTTDVYLKRMKHALAEFQKSGEVHDREDFYQFLEKVNTSQGKFLLVLGGKSVGKSLVLRDFAVKKLSPKNYWPLLVDARGFPGVSLPIAMLKSYKKRFEQELFGIATVTEQDALKLMKSIITSFSNNANDAADAELVPNAYDKRYAWRAFSTFIDSLIASRNVTDSGEVLQWFIRSAKSQGKRPVLIIDEANKVLGLGMGQQATSSTLDQIVQCTKQSLELDVIMASSEYSYPYLLEDNGLNLNDISNILFAGEIPPKSIWELLVTKKIGKTSMPVIGMGENLAHLLIASYGGHFLRLSSALEHLMDEKEHFFLDMALNPISENISNVLKVHPHEGLMYLRCLAECGFAPVADSRDPVVEMIVRSNIGGIVTSRKSKVVGLPSTIWNINFSLALIPTSESARNLIAKEVLLEEERQKKERRQKEERRLEVERRWWNRIRFWRKK